MMSFEHLTIKLKQEKKCLVKNKSLQNYKKMQFLTLFLQQKFYFLVENLKKITMSKNIVKLKQLFEEHLKLRMFN